MSETVLKSGIEWLAEFSRERRQARAKHGPTVYFRTGGSYEFLAAQANNPIGKWIMACRPGWTRSKQPKKWRGEIASAFPHHDPFVSAVMRLQGCVCYICNRPFAGPHKVNEGTIHEKNNYDNCPTRDHVLPQSLGGRDNNNILIAHMKCNQEKASRMPTACELLLLEIVTVKFHRERDLKVIDWPDDYELNMVTSVEPVPDQEHTGVKQMLDVSR